MSDRKLKWRLWKFVITLLMQIHIRVIKCGFHEDYDSLQAELDYKIQEE